MNIEKRTINYFRRKYGAEIKFYLSEPYEKLVSVQFDKHRKDFVDAPSWTDLFAALTEFCKQHG